MIMIIIVIVLAKILIQLTHRCEHQAALDRGPFSPFFELAELRTFWIPERVRPVRSLFCQRDFPHEFPKDQGNNNKHNSN